MGVGDAVQNSKALDNAVAELALISGQKPLVTRAKKSIATYRPVSYTHLILGFLLYL